jgi:hypothetical protein
MFDQQIRWSFAWTILAGVLAACSQPTEPGKIYSRLHSTGPLREAEHPAEFRLHAPERAAAGSVVPLRLVLANRGAEPLEVGMQGEEFDVVITALDGTVVWEALYGLDLSARLVIAIVEPDDSLNWRTEWRQRDTRGRRVPPGSYLARGVLLGKVAGQSGFAATPAVTIHIGRRTTGRRRRSPRLRPRPLSSRRPAADPRWGCRTSRCAGCAPR